MFDEPSSVRLRRQLLEEIDGLADALASDRLRAACLILNWAANAGNYALVDELSQATTSFVQTASAAEAYYDQFLPRKGAVYCAGMSLFFDQLLKTFGYGSFTINFGDTRDGLTHVTVVVPISDGAAWTHHVLDPTFNTTFHNHETGCQLGFFELLDALEGDGGTMDEVVAVAGDIDSRNWMSIGPFRKRHKFTLRGVIGDHYVYERAEDNTFLDYYLNNRAGALAANEYSTGLRGFVQLMRARLFGMGASTNDDALRDFTSQLQARSIPFGAP